MGNKIYLIEDRSVALIGQFVVRLPIWFCQPYLEPEEADELLMLLIVPVDNYTTNKNGQGGGKGQPGLMERSLANFMGLRQPALGYQFAWMNESETADSDSDSEAHKDKKGFAKWRASCAGFCPGLCPGPWLSVSL